MSVLALAEPSRSAVTDAPAVLTWPGSNVAKPRHTQQDVVVRARLLHRNATCRTCGRATVDPIELDDALLNRSGLAIPGTATVVGFACSSCSNEWSTDRPRLRIYG